MTVKLIVLSDIHHDIDRVRGILPVINSSSYLVFCGDGINGLMSIRGEITVPMVCAKGNNDWYSTVSETSTISIGQTRALVTHGHKYNVRRGMDLLIEAAKANDCKLVFFGHTHIPYDAVHSDIHVINPGAVCAGSYAIVTGDGDDFTCKHLTFK